MTDQQQSGNLKTHKEKLVWVLYWEVLTMREARLMCFETELITIHFHHNYMIISCSTEDCFGCFVSFSRFKVVSKREIIDTW